MITMQEWKAMSEREQTLWLEVNFNKGARYSRCKLVYGFGKNDSHYAVQPRVGLKRFRCPAYDSWCEMIRRTNCDKFKELNPTYIGSTVCERWSSFICFRDWWIDNYVDGFQIDKDILSDDMHYSPDSCLFVPQWLNLFITDSGASRGEWPIGVCYRKGRGRFQALCRNPASKRQEHIGYFRNPEAAHLAWRTRKLELALELKPKMDSIDLRIYPRVVEIINSAK